MSARQLYYVEQDGTDLFHSPRSEGLGVPILRGSVGNSQIFGLLTTV